MCDIFLLVNLMLNRTFQSYIASKGRITMNDILKGCCKALFQHLLEKTEVMYENRQSR